MNQQELKEYKKLHTKCKRGFCPVCNLCLFSYCAGNNQYAAQLVENGLGIYQVVKVDKCDDRIPFLISEAIPI
jgi:hypothetical protein